MTNLGWTCDEKGKGGAFEELQCKRNQYIRMLYIYTYKDDKGQYPMFNVAAGLPGAPVLPIPPGNVWSNRRDSYKDAWIESPERNDYDVVKCNDVLKNGDGDYKCKTGWSE